jgi:hypothetical protein
MRRCYVGSVVSDVSKSHISFLLRVNYFTLNVSNMCKNQYVSPSKVPTDETKIKTDREVLV